MRYKASVYNVIDSNESGLFVWNTYSGALLRLQQDGFDYLMSFPHDNDDSSFFHILEKHGVIVPEKLDELGRVIFNEKNALFSLNNEKISMVIALGMSCNYKCTYCFQSSANHSESMSDETALNIAEFICKRLSKSPNTKKLNIRWFGGEPLLYMHQIKLISDSVISYAQSHNIEFTAGIITNGLFLTKRNVDFLNSLHVTTAQVTVDGTEQIYCESKGASPKDFKLVISNIVQNSALLKISIRLNIPGNNAKEAIRTTDFILKRNGLLGKVGIYFAFVRDFSNHDARIAYTEYVDQYMIWLDYVVKKYGFSMVDGIYPRRKTTSCGYIRSSNFCIDYHGQLFKCEHCFGIENSVIGDIWTGDYYNTEEMCYLHSVEDHKECLNCNFLPICMGGCAHDRVCGQTGQDCNAFKRMYLKLKLVQGQQALI